MKKSFLLVIATAISFSIFAQLKVESNGIVNVGSPFGHTPNPARDCKLQILGPYTEYNAGGRLAFGDLGTSGGFNVVIGEYGTTDSDKLQLQGKLGTFFTTGPYGTYVAMKIENNHVYATNNVYAQSFVTLSDKRFKNNILPIKNASGLFKLRPVSFQYNISTSKENSATTNVSDVKKNNSLAEAKSPNDKLGFLAQEVREVYPQLVHEDANGTLSVDYVSMIPLLVEALKTQQNQIDDLQNELNRLKVADRNVQTSNTTNGAAGNADSTLVTLYQNAPNPFKETTTINFSISSSIAKAELHIFSLQGEQVKKYPITTRGNGSLEIKANELRPGLYYYAIVYDKNISNTKAMVITE